MKRKLKNLYKYALLSALLFSMVVGTSSCVKTNKLLSRSIVSAIGIDADEEGFIVTVQTYNTASESQKFFCYTSHGKDVHEALENAELLSGKENYYPQLLVVLIGQSAFEYNLINIIEPLVRDPEVQAAVPVIATEGSAHEILASENEPLKTLFQLGNYSQYYNSHDYLQKATLLNLYTRLDDKMCEVYLPIVNYYPPDSVQQFNADSLNSQSGASPDGGTTSQHSSGSAAGLSSSANQSSAGSGGETASSVGTSTSQSSSAGSTSGSAEESPSSSGAGSTSGSAEESPSSSGAGSTSGSAKESSSSGSSSAESSSSASSVVPDKEIGLGSPTSSAASGSGGEESGGESGESGEGSSSGSKQEDGKEDIDSVGKTGALSLEGAFYFKDGYMVDKFDKNELDTLGWFIDNEQKNILLTENEKFGTMAYQNESKSIEIKTSYIGEEITFNVDISGTFSLTSVDKLTDEKMTEEEILDIEEQLNTQIEENIDKLINKVYYEDKVDIFNLFRNFRYQYPDFVDTMGTKNYDYYIPKSVVNVDVESEIIRKGAEFNQ